MPEIHISKSGNGPTLVLLHGFPMNSQVWRNFVPLLSPSLTVVTIDLPGFGSSKILPAPFSIGQVAKAVLTSLTADGIDQFVVAGHSLGGYVALEMARQEPDRLKGLCLFHSTAYPDSDERKVARLKVIEFVDRNGAEAFTANFIPPLFNNPDHLAIAEVRKTSVQSTAEAVKGYALAMRDRASSIDVLEKFQNPILFLVGEKDGGIPLDSILKQAEYTQRPDVQVLENVAHMGMFEAPSKCGQLLIDFVETCHTAIR